VQNVDKDAYEYNQGNLDSNQDTDTLRFLELIEKDYKDARKQLEHLGQTLEQRETMVSQRIRNSRVSSGNSFSLCLLSYHSNTTRNQLGTAILGIIEQKIVIPEVIRLEIHCLDGFQVRFGGERVERWESTKARSLLQYLMIKPRKPVAKEELMEALWPDCDPRVSGNNLKAAMHGLRQTFNNLLDKEQNLPYIVYSQGTYQINPDIFLWLDVEQFEQHWQTGRRLQAEGDMNKAMQEFRLAEELYKGEYLEDDPYEEWTLLRREALHDIYLNILSKLAENCLQNADYENCIAYSIKTLDRDNCREDAYQRVMRCYNRLGLRNRALQWYEICRKTIAAQLDTEPDQATVNLYRQLVNNKPV
jgi:DNA-binding SARP family transcriptional activator